MKGKSDLLKLDRQICFQLYLASKNLTRAYQPLLAPLGLTYPQYLALMVLWETDGIAVKALGERLHLDSGTLSPLLKRLQGKKLVEKSRSAEDERSVTIRLTSAGRALKAKAQCVPTGLFEASGLSASEAEALFSGLRKLNANLEAEEG